MKLKEVKNYYSTGKLWQHWFEDENGVLEGVYENYFENGQLKAKCFYKNGVREGVYEWYYENGQLREKYFYKNGVELTPKEYRKLKMNKLKELLNEIE